MGASVHIALISLTICEHVTSAPLYGHLSLYLPESQSLKASEYENRVLLCVLDRLPMRGKSANGQMRGSAKLVDNETLTRVVLAPCNFHETRKPRAIRLVVLYVPEHKNVP